MTIRTHTQKDGTEWSWEETPELLELLRQLHEKKEEPETK